jgi:hypothetical protein
VICPKDHSPPSFRYEIASQMTANFFLCIDDDIFLLPYQIKILFEKLIENPSVPHGTYGSELLINDYIEKGSSKVKITCKHHFQVETEVDEIYQTYAFTKFHVVQYFNLLKRIRGENSCIDGLNFCDDIILSFSGKGRPIIHNLGKILACYTFDNDNIAVFKMHNFENFRDVVRLTIRNR